MLLGVGKRAVKLVERYYPFALLVLVANRGRLC